MEPIVARLRLINMGDIGEVAAFLAAHDGIITTKQAVSCGLTRHLIDGKVRRGEWLRLAPGVFRSAAHDYTETAMVRAVVVAHRGIADGTTAAWWFGMLKELPLPLTLSCLNKPAPIDWPVTVRVSRRKLQPEMVTECRDLALTTKAVTALICAVELPEGSAFLDRMLQVKQVGLDELQHAVVVAAGMHGIVEARRLVAVASSDSESEAERLFVRLLQGRGVTGWVQQMWSGRFRLDFAWPEQQVAVEISGWTFHRYQERHANDINKANHLEAISWRELQFNWHMLNDSGEACVGQVIALLNSRGADIF